MASFTSILAFSCPSSLHALPTPTPHCPTLPQPLAIYQSLFCSWDKEDEERDSSNLTAEMKIWEEHVSWESPEKPCLWCLTAPPRSWSPMAGSPPLSVLHSLPVQTLCPAGLPFSSPLMLPFPPPQWPFSPNHHTQTSRAGSNATFSLKRHKQRKNYEV